MNKFRDWIQKKMGEWFGSQPVKAEHEYEQLHRDILQQETELKREVEFLEVQAKVLARR